MVFHPPRRCSEYPLVDGDESRVMDEVCAEHMLGSSNVQPILIKDVEFELTHVKLHVSSAQAHKIVTAPRIGLSARSPSQGRFRDYTAGFMMKRAASSMDVMSARPSWTTTSDRIAQRSRLMRLAKGG